MGPQSPHNRRTTPQVTWPTGFCHAQTSVTDRHTVTVCGQYSTNTRAKGKNRRMHRVGSRLRTITKIIVQEKRGKTMTSSVYTTTDTATDRYMQKYRSWEWGRGETRPTVWIPGPWETKHERYCLGYRLPHGLSQYFQWAECGCPRAVATTQKPFDTPQVWHRVHSPDEVVNPGDIWIGEDVRRRPRRLRNFTAKG